MASAGEVPARLKPLAVLSVEGLDRALPRLKPVTRDGVLEWPLIAVAVEHAGGIAVAEQATAAGFFVEAFLANSPEHSFTDDELRQRAAAVLRQAWRIRVVRAGTASDALKANCKVLIDAEGRLDETALA